MVDPVSTGKGALVLGRLLSVHGEKLDAKLAAEYREHMDDIVVEQTSFTEGLRRIVEDHARELDAVRSDLADLVGIISNKWEGEDDADRPIAADVVHAFVRFAHDHDRAGTNAKRRQLFRALVGEFDPKFYRDGWSRILGEMARRLEPPHVVLLRKVRDHVRNKAPVGTSKRQSFYGSHVTMDEYPLLRELSALGLVHYETTPTGPLTVRVSDVADRFIAFLASIDDEPTAAASVLPDE